MLCRFYLIVNFIIVLSTFVGEISQYESVWTPSTNIKFQSDYIDYHNHIFIAILVIQEELRP